MQMHYLELFEKLKNNSLTMKRRVITEAISSTGYSYSDYDLKHMKWKKRINETNHNIAINDAERNEIDGYISPLGKVIKYTNSLVTVISQ